jgi:hypothetical protein
MKLTCQKFVSVMRKYFILAERWTDIILEHGEVTILISLQTHQKQSDKVYSPFFFAGQVTVLSTVTFWSFGGCPIS